MCVLLYGLTKGSSTYHTKKGEGKGGEGREGQSNTNHPKKELPSSHILLIATSHAFEWKASWLTKWPRLGGVLLNRGGWMMARKPLFSGCGVCCVCGGGM